MTVISQEVIKSDNQNNLYCLDVEQVQTLRRGESHIHNEWWGGYKIRVIFHRTSRRLTVSTEGKKFEVKKGDEKKLCLKYTI